MNSEIEFLKAFIPLVKAIGTCSTNDSFRKHAKKHEEKLLRRISKLRQRAGRTQQSPRA